MPRLFSYGSLQQPAVQLATFGRSLPGQSDALPGFELLIVRRGEQQLANVISACAQADSRVAGMVFEISDAELHAADAYERADAYTRIPGGAGLGRRGLGLCRCTRADQLVDGVRMNIAGSCHCGNISFSLDWPDDAARNPRAHLRLHVLRQTWRCLDLASAAPRCACA